MDTYSSYGAINPVGVVPGFVVPLFVSGTPDNRLYVQIISAGDRIGRFEPIDIGDAPIVRHDQPTVRALGDPALWAFQFEDGNCAIDERQSLRAIVASQERSFSPLLRLQTAALFETDDFAARLSEAHLHLNTIAPRSADLWRDLVILLPRIRRAALAAVKRPTAQIRAAVDAIDIVTRGETLTLAVPVNLIEDAGSELVFSQSLSPLQPVLDALGISRLDIQQRELKAPLESQTGVPKPSGLTIVHCLRDLKNAPARKLRDVLHLDRPDLVDDAGVLAPSMLPDSSELVFLFVEEHKEQVRAAKMIAQAATARNTRVAALIIPRIEKQDGKSSYRPIRQTADLSSLASHCIWISYASDWMHHDDVPEPLRSNPHFDRQIEDVARWTPHALRACINAGDAGNVALNALGKATARFRSASVSTAASRGTNAAEVAATAVLTASRRTHHPAISAQLIVLVAFYNRKLHSSTRDEIERAALACNREAKIVVVEEHREDMRKRVRIVAITTGHQRTSGQAYVPPARLMPLVRAGWKIEPVPYWAHWQFNSITHKGHSYVLQFEPELTVSAGNVDEVIATTSMHHGEVALLVEAIADEIAVERLLQAGIFCAVIRQRQTFERFAGPPGAMMQAALATLSRAEIADRLRHYSRHYVLAALWQLVPYWQRDEPSPYAHWREGRYEREPRLENFELYRTTEGGKWFFRGAIRLSPTKPDIPLLSYAFGFALEAKGLRLTRLTPLAGAFDMRVDAQRRYEGGFRSKNDRRSGAKTSSRDGSTESIGEQLALPGLSEVNRKGAY